jgi:hypothetical protein
MNLLTLTIAFAFITGVLFYQEQTDRSLNAHTISAGWMAAGLIVRITLLIVMVVLIGYSFSTI